MENSDAKVEFLAETLALAGAELRNRFGGRLEVARKKDFSLVTSSDLASEKIIIDRIRRYFPDHQIWSEESGASAPIFKPGAFVWIIDPLDGTTNYANHYPFYAVSIALGVVEPKGNITVTLGGIQDPTHNDQYLAVRGKGATWNGTTIRVAERRPLAQCFLCTGFAYKVGGDLRNDIEKFSEISGRCQSIRRDGAAALDLALASRGVFDCFWESGLSAWDVAAGSLLVTESGGSAVNFAGDRHPSFLIEDGSIIAGNRQVVDELAEIVRRH